ncbi:hypothetical protein WICMUC_001140 [Wickerhamomyces mucosus]|uniref:5'-3' DNA helicase ZGRF1-like N-terminal domain-containing protein n=1 Tax=Wickerhamomyces mucosus TaxID=1378264 RepID=A0A9P8PXB2_9ASCO|nr:hypothetical protein WICMUC_001140 [Wickerhamomyces mucosus]
MSQAQTQLLSEVVEYEIQYSLDLNKKHKLFKYDGILKVYKFNNKYQVLNDENIVVTNEFKNNHKFNIGDQFQVGCTIIRVDDFRSTITRDITNAFQKRIDETKKTPIIVKTSANKPITPSSTNIGLKRRRIGLSRMDTPSKMTKCITPISHGKQDGQNSYLSIEGSNKENQPSDQNEFKEFKNIIAKTPRRKLLISDKSTNKTNVSNKRPHLIFRPETENIERISIQCSTGLQQESNRLNYSSIELNSIDRKDEFNMNISFEEDKLLDTCITGQEHKSNEISGILSKIQKKTGQSTTIENTHKLEDLPLSTILEKNQMKRARSLPKLGSNSTKSSFDSIVGISIKREESDDDNSSSMIDFDDSEGFMDSVKWDDTPSDLSKYKQYPSKFNAKSSTKSYPIRSNRFGRETIKVNTPTIRTIDLEGSSSEEEIISTPPLKILENMDNEIYTKTYNYDKVRGKRGKRISEL